MHKSTQAATVWVVDDDRSVRFVLTTALRDAGYTVEGFDSAAAALGAMTRQPVPDLLFTDVRMPGDDGLVLLDKLKTAHPQLPVIVMSAYTMWPAPLAHSAAVRMNSCPSPLIWTMRWSWRGVRCPKPKNCRSR